MGNRLIAATILIYALSVPHATFAQTLRYTVGDPLRFGVGYNTLTGQYAGMCTVPPQTTEIKPAGDSDAPTIGQLTKWELSSETDLTSLSEKLDFSASASASFAMASASISVDYMKSKAFNKYHEFLYVDAAVANGTQIWTKPALSKDSLNLRKKPLDFLVKCGDSFVQTITTGGELTAVLDVTTTAQEDTSNLTVAVSGDYSGVGGSAKLAQQIQQKLANHQVQVKVIRAGGAGSLPTYTADELIAASLKFPNEVAKNPVPLQAQLASYDTISPPTPLTIAQQTFIKPLFRAYKRSMQNQGNLHYIQAHTSEFRRIVPQNSNSMSAADHLKAVTELSSSQLVVSTGFEFTDLDMQAINNASDKEDDYSNALEALAQKCLDDPKTKCSGDLPKPPEQVLDVVRVFSVTQDWNTSAGPVDITLDQAYRCTVDNISGNWKPGDGRTLSCSNSLPTTVTQGHIVVGSFDSPSMYGDNIGTCTYHFLCTRR